MLNCHCGIVRPVRRPSLNLTGLNQRLRLLTASGHITEAESVLTLLIHLLVLTTWPRESARERFTIALWLLQCPCVGAVGESGLE